MYAGLCKFFNVGSFAVSLCGCFCHSFASVSIQPEMTQFKLLTSWKQGSGQFFRGGTAYTCLPILESLEFVSSLFRFLFA